MAKWLDIDGKEYQMIKCTTVGVEPSDMCYEICVMARECGALKAWEKERKNDHIDQTEGDEK